MVGRKWDNKVGLMATHCAQNGSLHGVKSEPLTAMGGIITTLGFATGNLNYIFWENIYLCNVWLKITGVFL